MKMRFVVTLAAVLGVLGAALPGATAQDKATSDKVAGLLKQGDAAYRKAYSDKQTWAALYFYKEAVKLDPRSFDAQWRVARGYFWLADNTENKGKDKDLGWQGYAAGLQAIRLNPKRVEGHYWAGLCLGEYSKGLGIITALRKGIEGKFRGHLNRAMAIKRCYDNGGADRAYGNFFHLVPWPKRDRERSLKHFNWSLRCRKDVPRTHFYMAVVLAAEDKKAEAIKNLETCLKVKRGTATDNHRVKWHCKKLLKKLKQ